MPSINPNGVYTTNEAQALLKVSGSTLKRLLKRGLIRANKVGGQYRILGKEMLHLLSPRVERKTTRFYQRLKQRLRQAVKYW